MELKVILQNKFLFLCLTFFALNIYNYGNYALTLYLIGSLHYLNRESFGKPFMMSLFLTLFLAFTLNEYYITWGVKMMIASMVGSIIARKIQSIYAIKTIIIYCAIIYAIQLYLSYQYNISIGNTTSRTFINLATMEVSAYTAFAVLLTPAAAIFPFYLYKSNPTSKIELLMISLLAMFSVTVNLWLSGRSFWGILILSMLFTFVYTIKNSPDSKNTYKKVTFILLAFIVIFTFYNEKVAGIYTNSNFYNRFNSGYEDINDTPRYEVYLYYLSHFGDSFFGGGHIREQIHLESHTLWLDVMDMCGILPFLVICTMSIFSFNIIKKICSKHNNLEFDFKLIMFSFSICCLIQFCLEPVIEGSQWIVILYWLLITIIYYQKKFLCIQHTVLFSHERKESNS